MPRNAERRLKPPKIHLQINKFMTPKFTDKDTIFATGVFLQPIKCTINGIKQWRWVAVGFEDGSYYDNREVNPLEYADDIDNLLEEFES